jgi:predicted Zn-dependent protease with MMP-like domain
VDGGGCTGCGYHNFGGHGHDRCFGCQTPWDFSKRVAGGGKPGAVAGAKGARQPDGKGGRWSTPKCPVGPAKGAEPKVGVGSQVGGGGLVSGAQWFSSALDGGGEEPVGMECDEDDEAVGPVGPSPEVIQRGKDDLASSRSMAKYHRAQVKELGSLRVNDSVSVVLVAEIGRHTALAEEHEQAVKDRLVLQRGEQPNEVQLGKKQALLKTVEANIAKAVAEHKALLEKARVIDEETQTKVEYIAVQEAKAVSLKAEVQEVFARLGAEPVLEHTSPVGTANGGDITEEERAEVLANRVARAAQRLEAQARLHTESLVLAALHEQVRVAAAQAVADAAAAAAEAAKAPPGSGAESAPAQVSGGSAGPDAAPLSGGADGSSAGGKGCSALSKDALGALMATNKAGRATPY